MKALMTAAATACFAAAAAATAQSAEQSMRSLCGAAYGSFACVQQVSEPGAGLRGCGCSPIPEGSRDPTERAIRLCQRADGDRGGAGPPRGLCDGSTYVVGIVERADALQPGSNGDLPAMLLAQNARITWYASGIGNSSATIESDLSNSTSSVALLFGNGGLTSLDNFSTTSPNMVFLNNTTATNLGSALAFGQNGVAQYSVGVPSGITNFVLVDDTGGGIFLQRGLGGNLTTLAGFTQLTPLIGLIPGCVGNGVADDTVCVQTAINDYQYRTLWLGPYLYSVNALTTGTIHIIGERSGGGIYNRTCNTGLKARSTTESLLTITGDNSVIENVCFQMGTAVNQQTAGSGIVITTSASNVLRNNQINYPFYGLYITGVGTTQNNSTIIDGNVIADPSVNGAGIFLGNQSNTGNTVGTRVLNNLVDCVDFSSGLPRANTIGMWLQDTVGAYFTNNDIYGCGTGTYIAPLMDHQYATNNFFSNTVLGDTSAANSLVIDDLCSTCNAGLGTTFSATWTASAAGTDIYIANPGGSSLFGGFKFLGHRSFPLANQIGVQINAGTNIEFNGTKICPQGGTLSDLVQINNTVSNWSFIDGDFGVCDLLPAGTSNVGIHVTSSSVNVGRIQDNSFIGVTTPIVWATSGSTTARIEGNLGLDTLVFSVAVSDPITLPVGEVVAITGNGTISTMNGMWSNRKVTIIPQGTINFITGGNICNSATGNNEIPVLAVWNSLNGCWGLK